MCPISEKAEPATPSTSSWKSFAILLCWVARESEEMSSPAVRHLSKQEGRHLAFFTTTTG